MNLIEINSLHARTLTLIIVGALLFSLGGLLAFLVPPPAIAKRLTLIGTHARRIPRPQYSWFKYVLIAVIVLVLFAQIKALFSAAAQGSSYNGSFLMRARSAEVANISEKGSVRNSLTYLEPWITFAAVLFQIESRDRLFKLSLVIALISCIVGTGRVSFLSLFSALTCVYLLQAKRENFRAAYRFVRWPFAMFLLLFVVLLFTNKDTSNVQTTAAKFAEDSVVEYIIGPTAALDYVLEHAADYVGAPNHSFKSFLTIAGALGITSYTPPPALDSFLFVPFPTNVYTVYKFYFTDFGLYAAAAIMGILGFGHALLYRKAHTDSRLALYFFALTMFPVLMVTFDDWFVAFGGYLNALIFGGLYFALRSVPIGISIGASNRREKLENRAVGSY